MVNRIIFITIITLFSPTFVSALTLTENTIWKDTVVLEEDILVPEGITLTIAPGTIVKIKPAESTKIDPEYLTHRTEILVRGKILAEGTSMNPILFNAQENDVNERWAGLIVDHGEVFLKACRIQDAETGIYIINGKLNFSNGLITGNRYGIVNQSGKSDIYLNKVVIVENDYGILSFGNEKVQIEESTISGNNKKDVYKAAVDVIHIPIESRKIVEIKNITRVYKNEALVGDTIWKGRIIVEGIVRLPPEGRLTILPGTIIEFTKTDTNGDNIGENGLLIQGVFIAKGTPQSPIVFRSAQSDKKRGDWDSINILGSDRNQNLIEFCQIENAYRGLHFHFSNVLVSNTVLKNNYRGAQFQESLVEIKDSHFYENKSGIQARDSEVYFHDNILMKNHTGANFFRLNLKATNNYFVNNNEDGLRVREGTVSVENNFMGNNRYGLLIADAVYGSYKENIISHNLESGLSLRNVDHIEITENIIQKNKLNGIIIQDSRPIIQKNLIAENGERGVGILSFNGILSQNNIYNNGEYGIGLDGDMSVSAANNWWGNSNLDSAIYDKKDEIGLGEVHYTPLSSSPFTIKWPNQDILTDLIWAGSVKITSDIEVTATGELTVQPGTVILFSKDKGLHVIGKISAKGKKTERITFSALDENGPSSWEEVHIERASEAIFSYCDFKFAKWGLHVHFTPLTVTNCRFLGNDGGIRFRSGPLNISNSLFRHNRIGIRSFRGVADINKNEIFENEIGIFVREKGGGIRVSGNNIHDNFRYNLRLGDFNKEDVDARNNWWGEKKPLETFFDGRIESYIGMVLYEPFSENPYTLDIK